MIWGHKFVVQFIHFYRYNKSIKTKCNGRIRRKKLSPFCTYRVQCICMHMHLWIVSTPLLAHAMHCCDCKSLLYFPSSSSFPQLLLCVQLSASFLCEYLLLVVIFYKLYVGRCLYADCIFSNFPCNHRNNYTRYHDSVICVYSIADSVCLDGRAVGCGHESTRAHIIAFPVHSPKLACMRACVCMCMHALFAIFFDATTHAVGPR